MKPVPPAVTEEIREKRRAGSLIKPLAREYGYSKSTISLYCRDISAVHWCKYKTEEEAREATRKKHKQSMKLCPVCKERQIRKDKRRCRECYFKEIRANRIFISKKDKGYWNPSTKVRKGWDAYLKSDIWRCLESPTEAHHWVEKTCKYCGETRNVLQG